MAKKEITTTTAPQPVGPYSQAIVANGFIFTAGFGPQDPSTGEVPEGIEAQTRQVLRNVEAALAAHGAGLAELVKATVHLQNLHDDYEGFNRVYRDLVPEPFPARTTVGSELQGILVEIDVVATAAGR